MPKRMKERKEENHNLQAGKTTYMYCKYTVTITENQRKNLKNNTQLSQLIVVKCILYAKVNFSTERVHVYAHANLISGSGYKPQSTQSGNGKFVKFSGVQSIMRVKSAKAGICISTITYKVVVYAPAEMTDTLQLFLLLPLYLLCGTDSNLRRKF
jgi:hypothetical protein